MQQSSAYLRLLGGVQLEREGVPLTGRGAQRRRLAVLSLLAATGPKGMSRERIAAILWPDMPDDRGRRQVTEAVYQLRRELGESAIEGTGEILRLNESEVGSDVSTFRQAIERGDLASSAQAYSGAFLEGWHVPDAPEFDQWATTIRATFSAEYRRVLSQLADDAAQAGDLGAALTWLERLRREDPLSASTIQQVAELLRRSGEPARAVATIQEYEALLKQELDAPLSPELQALLHRLRTGMGSDSKTILGTAMGSDSRTSGLESDPKRDSYDRPEPGNTRRRMAGVVLVAVLALAVTTWSVLRNRADASERGVRFDPHHIAVLYFDDHSAGRQLTHIADGLTEELIHQLAQLPGLRVVSRNSVKRFREHPVSPDSLAEQLRAGSLVEGSVQLDGDNIRVVVQLIDGNTGLHVESEEITRPIGDLFELQRDLATTVAAGLRRRLGADVQLARNERETRNSAALGLVLRAQRLRSDATTMLLSPHSNDVGSAARTLVMADSLLDTAQRLDPNWPRPALERGWVSLQTTLLGAPGSSGARALSRARAAHIADSLLANHPQHAEALELRGTARWQTFSASMATAIASTAATDAEADLRSAVRIDSSRASAWATLADLLNVQGNFAEAAIAAERALEADAWLDGAEQTHFVAFAANTLLGKYDAARRWCAQGRSAFPTSWRFVECELTVMRDDRNVRPNTHRAEQLVAKMDSLDPPERAVTSGHAYSPYYRRAVLATLFARAGERDRARQEIDALRERTKGDSTLTLDLAYDEAFVYLTLRDTLRARSRLTELMAARPMLREQLARDSLWLAVSSPAERIPAGRCDEADPRTRTASRCRPQSE